MNAVIDGVKARIKVHSGDDKAVAKDASRGSIETQNGGAGVDKTIEEESAHEAQDSSLQLGEGTGMIGGKSSMIGTDAQTLCGQCCQEFGSKATKPPGRTKTKEVQCSFCGIWQCGVCIKFNVADLALLERNDVLIAYMGCQGGGGGMMF